MGYDEQKRQGSGLRVLMQNRPHAYTHRGGDTVVMEKLADGLRQRGVHVVIDIEGKQDPRQFDIVHLFNFATPEITLSQARRAYEAGVPYVVTSLYEDIPSFHNQSQVVAATVVEYVFSGQNRSHFEAQRLLWSRVTPTKHFDNDWTARHASALFSSGPSETKVLQRDYPGIKQPIEVKFGYDFSLNGTPDEFVRTYGVKDFVLCVGRLESRKNQLMLLKALEDIDLPVVLATGGVAYQPDYEQAVKAFRRKGQTILVNRLSPEMLASMYAAARVHVLPSWYELPGIVSQEAAYYGRNIVVTDRGTSRDYFGDLAFYCQPDNESTILSALMAAYYSPVNPGLKETVMKNTWDEAARKVWESYRGLAGGSPQASSHASSKPVEIVKEITLASSEPSPEIEAMLTEGEEAARRREYGLADDTFIKVMAQAPRTVRALRGRGAVRLAQGDFEGARAFFEQAYAVNANDAKTLSGIGMCDMMAQKPEEAYPKFVKALALDGNHLVTILQLVECSYRLSRFDDLERVLRAYNQAHPEDGEMAYCFAGALFKLGRESECEIEIDRILTVNPDHLGAKQLKDFIAERRQKAAAPEVSPASSPAIAVRTAVQPSASESALDMQIAELEERKRSRDFAGARAGCEAILGTATLTAAQAERAMLLFAEVNVLDGNIDEATSIFDQVLAANPRSARAMCGKGAIAASKDSWEEAEQLFAGACQVHSDYDVALAGLALCASWKKKFDEAWEYYARALKKNPENVRALLGVIELGYPLSRLSDVEVHLRAYLESHPADLEFIYALAGCCFAQNKTREALEEVNRITLFAPDHERAIELRSMIESKEAQTSGVSNLGRM